jgi:hypothetical protein
MPPYRTIPSNEEPLKLLICYNQSRRALLITDYCLLITVY